MAVNKGRRDGAVKGRSQIQAPAGDKTKKDAAAVPLKDRKTGAGKASVKGVAKKK